MKTPIIHFEFKKKKANPYFDLYNLFINGKKAKDPFRKYEPDESYLFKSHFELLRSFAIDDFPFDKKLYFQAQFDYYPGQLCNLTLIKSEKGIDVEVWYSVDNVNKTWALNPFRLMLLVEKFSKSKYPGIERCDIDEGGGFDLIFKYKVPYSSTFEEAYQKGEKDIANAVDKAIKQLIEEGADYVKRKINSPLDRRRSTFVTRIKTKTATNQ